MSAGSWNHGRRRRGRPVPRGQDLMTPAEVAAAFRVDVGTVARWRRTGKLPAVRTPGEGYRYQAEQVRRLLGGQTTEVTP